jgi:cyanophycinase
MWLMNGRSRGGRKKHEDRIILNVLKYLFIEFAFGMSRKKYTFPEIFTGDRVPELSLVHEKFVLLILGFSVFLLTNGLFLSRLINSPEKFGSSRQLLSTSRRRRCGGEISGMTSQTRAGKGVLVAIGGGEDKTSQSEILQRVLELSSSDNREVGVVTTASSIPDEVFPTYEQVFTQLGAAAVRHIDVRTREEAAEDRFLDVLRQCDIIFMSGGDQLRLTHILGGSPLLNAMRERLAEGAVVAGTSAGAAAQSATMIYEGAAADALRKGAVKMSAGFGFVEGVVIDSHFLERGRFTRLIEVGAANPEFLGIGIGEDAGAIFYDNLVLEAIGTGHVIVIDSSRLKSSNVASLSEGEPVAVEHVTMHALTSGFGYDIKRRRFLQPGEMDRADTDGLNGDT